MFVTFLEMDRFVTPKGIQLKNLQFVYGRGSSGVETYIASATSTPYVSKPLTVLFHTQPLFSSLVYWGIQHQHYTLGILVKAQPST